MQSCVQLSGQPDCADNIHRSTEELLRERIEQLEREVAKAKMGGKFRPTTQVTQREDKLPPMSVTRVPPKQKKIQGFCYRCGEDSHYLSQCGNPVNAELVQRKLVQRQQQTPVAQPTPSATEDLN